MVSPCSPPIPARLVEKIIRGEYVDLNALLSHRLGAPEPTLTEALQRKTREEKQITSIEQWVVCFSSYMSVVVLQIPHRTRDLLGYMSLVVKAAHNYEGTPWLAYDAHFRCLAATMQLQTWSTPDQSVWSQYFSRAAPKVMGASALSVGPYVDPPKGEAVTKGKSNTEQRRGGHLTNGRRQFAPDSIRYSRVHVSPCLPGLPRRPPSGELHHC